MKRLFVIMFAGFIVLGAGLATVYSQSGVRTIRVDSAALASLSEPVGTAPSDWPGWRGPHRDGVIEAAAPTQWSSESNIRWRADTIGRGHASPVVRGNSVFIFSCDEESQVLFLSCHDRASGSLTWRTELERGGLASKHEKNSFASATPTCDGRHVYVTYVAKGSLWTLAVDAAGKVVWRTAVGEYASKWGFGSSPVLFDSLVIVAGDNNGEGRLDSMVGASFIAAMDGLTGQLIWRTPREKGDSYGAPTIGSLAGKDQLLISGRREIASYNPLTGVLLWKCKWGADRTASTVSFGGDCVFANATFGDNRVMAIAADGSGDVTATHVRWQLEKGAADVPSTIFYQGHLYMVTDGGVLTCFAAQSGDVLWKKRLGGKFASSPVIANGKLYLTNEDGKTFVLATGEKYESISENELGQPTLSTPAFSKGEIFIRTDNSLFCIAPATGA